MKTRLFILMTLLLVIPISCKNQEEKERQDTIQMVNDLYYLHQDYLIQNLEKGITSNNQYDIDQAIKEYMQGSSTIYLSLCDIYMENYEDEEIGKLIDPMLHQIMDTQCNTLRDFASPLILIDVFKYTDQELDRLHQVGDLLEMDALNKYYQTIY